MLVPLGFGPLQPTRPIKLATITTLRTPDQVAISKAFEAFGDNGKLLDERKQTQVEKLGAELSRVITSLKGS